LFQCGSFTNRSQAADRGLEPDVCFFKDRESLGRSADDYVPPDLVVEIEISRSLLDRVGICAALGIPEIWRFDGQTLTVMTLGPDRTYQVAPRSPTFPMLPLPALSELLSRQFGLSARELIAAVRAWLREEGIPTVGDSPFANQ
jgi:Uma2 family endonuclease